MEKIYVRASKTIKLIMQEGFDFSQAMRIYNTVTKQLNAHVDISFIDELYILHTGMTNATDVYNAYLSYCSKNEIQPLSGTAFGTIMSKLTSKIKKRDANYYTLEIKPYERTNDTKSN